jgi:hypothetical protein
MRFLTLALVAVLATATVSAPARAADGDTVQYSRDARYLYAKTAIPLTMALSAEQGKALHEAADRMKDELLALQSINPRTGLRGRIDRGVVASAEEFSRSLDSLVSYAQQYYPVIAQEGLHVTSAIPTGLVVFTGFELTGGFIASGGGSVMLGIVLVPMHVTRIEIDTNKQDEYVTFDSNLIVWPSANVGVGVGGGTNLRGGMGLIWGQLASAKEFAGLVLGGSASADLGVGTNFKAQILKNWNKKGAVSNFFLTAGAEIGPSAKLEGHGNISYLIDAETYLKKGQAGIEAMLNKFFGSAPQGAAVSASKDKPVTKADVAKVPML